MKYGAHWSRSLVIMSLILTLVVLGIAALQAYLLDGIMRWNGILLLALLCGCALYTVRGYTIAPDALLVHRLFWSTRIPLTGVQSAAFEPDAMRGSTRNFGNGGIFSITGRFTSQSFGGVSGFCHRSATDGDSALCGTHCGCVTRLARGVRPGTRRMRKSRLRALAALS